MSFLFNPNAIEFVPKFCDPVEIKPEHLELDKPLGLPTEPDLQNHRKKSFFQRNKGQRENPKDTKKAKTKTKHESHKYQCKTKKGRGVDRNCEMITDELKDSTESLTSAPFVSPYLSAIMKPATSRIENKMPDIPTEPEEHTIQILDQKLQSMKLPIRNRVETTVSENALRKNNRKWMEISQKIAEKEKLQSQQEKSQPSSSSAKTETWSHEPNRWHSILKVPLPPVELYDLSPKLSNKPMGSFNQQAVGVEGKDATKLMAEWWEAVASGNFSTIAHCLDHGMDWEIRYDHNQSESSVSSLANCHGLTMLHICFKLCHAPRCTQEILSTYPFIMKNLDLKDRVNKRTVLHYVCEAGSTEHFQILLHQYPQIGLALIEKDRYGDTPLHLSCKHNHLPLITQLLEKMKKCDCLKINIRNKKGQTAAMLTTSSTILGLLLDYGGDVLTKDDHGLDVVLLAILHNDPARLRKVLTHNAFRLLKNEEQTKLSGNSVFSYELNMQYYTTTCSVGVGAISNEAQIVLEQKKFFKPSQDTLELTSSPLHLAVLLGHTDCLKALISSGYYPIDGIVYDTHRKADYSPLMYAMLSPAKLEIIFLLLQSSAEIGRENEHQLTEIGIAMLAQEHGILYALSQYIKHLTVCDASTAKLRDLFTFCQSNSSEDNIAIILRYLLARFRKTVIHSNVTLYESTTRSEVLERLGLTAEQLWQFSQEVREEYLPTFVVAIACGNVKVDKLFWHIVCSSVAYKQLQSLGLIEDWIPNITQPRKEMSRRNMKSSIARKAASKLSLHNIHSIGDVFPRLQPSVNAFLATHSVAKWSQDTCDLLLTVPVSSQSESNSERFLLLHQSMLQTQSGLVRQLLQREATCNTIVGTDGHLRIELTQVFTPSSASIVLPQSVSSVEISNELQAGHVNATSQYCLVLRDLSTQELLSSFIPPITFMIVQQLIDYCYTGYMNCLTLYPSKVQQQTPEYVLPALTQVCAIYRLAKALNCPKSLITSCEFKLLSLINDFNMNTFFSAKQKQDQMEVEKMKEWMRNVADPDSMLHSALVVSPKECSLPLTANHDTPSSDNNKKFSFYFQNLKSSRVLDLEEQQAENLTGIHKTQQNLSNWHALISTLTQPSAIHLLPLVTSRLLVFGKETEMEVTVEVVSQIDDRLYTHSPHKDELYSSDDIRGSLVEKEISIIEPYIRACWWMESTPISQAKQELEYGLDWGKFALLGDVLATDKKLSLMPVLGPWQRSQLVVRNLLSLFEETIARTLHRLKWWQHPVECLANVLITTHHDVDHLPNSFQGLPIENKIGGVSYAVHRDILIAHSPKFHAMITFQSSQQQNSPSNSSELLTLTISETSSFLLGQMLHFMYVGMIDVQAMECYARQTSSSSQLHHDDDDKDIEEPEEPEEPEEGVQVREEAYLMELYLQLATLADDYLMTKLTKQATLHVILTLTMENVNHYYQYACQARLQLLQQVTAMFLLRIMNISRTTPMEELIDLEVVEGDDSSPSKTEELASNGDVKVKPPKELMEFLLYIMESIIS